jgi:hypothetical protein
MLPPGKNSFSGQWRNWHVQGLFGAFGQPSQRPALPRCLPQQRHGHLLGPGKKSEHRGLDWLGLLLGIGVAGGA